MGRTGEDVRTTTIITNRERERETASLGKRGRRKEEKKRCDKKLKLITSYFVRTDKKGPIYCVVPWHGLNTPSGAVHLPPEAISSYGYERLGELGQELPSYLLLA